MAVTAQRHVPRQLGLIALLLAKFAFELADGIVLTLHPHSSGAAGLVSNLLVALLIIGILRAWEFVGDRETGIIASIAVLAGHDRNPDGPRPASAPPNRQRPNELATPDRWHSPGQTAVRSEFHFVGERVRSAALVRDGEAQWAVTPFFELAVTRGLYWKFGTNDPARAARAGGLVPGHLRRPAGPAPPG